MKVVVISNTDYNFSAKLSKICNDQSDDLLFCDDFIDLSKKNVSNSLIILDYDDEEENLDKVKSISKKISNSTFCIIMKNINSDTQKKLTKLGFDLIMSKQSFLINFSTIKKQFLLQK